jgi:colicin import membrane protein
MDNSVLFSLNELKTLEDDRLRAEAEAVKARRQAELRARIDAQEQAWCEAEAAAQAARDEAARQAEARERARLDEEVRAIQAEARMDEEAERLLDAARLEAEAHIDEMRAKARRPVWNVVALSLGAVAAVGGLGAWMMSRADAATARSEAVVQKHVAAKRARLVARRRPSAPAMRRRRPASRSS